MAIQSFTGPSRLTDEQARWAAARIEEIVPAQRRSGCAYGLDSIVAMITPIEYLDLYVPKGMWHNARLVARLVMEGATPYFIEGGYRRRNEELVWGSDQLHAFLRQPTFYRSGEWMTVNIARRAGVTVIEHILPA